MEETIDTRSGMTDEQHVSLMTEVAKKTRTQAYLELQKVVPDEFRDLNFEKLDEMMYLCKQIGFETIAVVYTPDAINCHVNNVREVMEYGRTCHIVDIAMFNSSLIEESRRRYETEASTLCRAVLVFWMNPDLRKTVSFREDV